MYDKILHSISSFSLFISETIKRVVPEVFISWINSKNNSLYFCIVTLTSVLEELQLIKIKIKKILIVIYEASIELVKEHVACFDWTAV